MLGWGWWGGESEWIQLKTIVRFLFTAQTYVLMFSACVGKTAYLAPNANSYYSYIHRRNQQANTKLGDQMRNAQIKKLKRHLRPKT